MSEKAPRDYYQLLGVSKDAKPDAIKKAFRKLAKELHPDVAGESPDANARFDEVRQAYETLSDAERRAEYDRRSTRRASYGPGPGWRPPGGNQFGGAPKNPRDAATRAWKVKANSLNLDDIFGEKDFGFGAGERTARARTAQGTPGAMGADISLDVEVPAEVAKRGGMVTLGYPRSVRADGSDALQRTEEIHDLRVPPGIAEGNVLRVPRMGHAGANGGRYGDLVCRIRVVNADAAPRAGEGDATTVPISITEALLGGRIEIEVPGGRVRVTVPPCTSSGTKMRLKGKGTNGSDLTLTLQIVVPSELDAESQELVRQLALLNPQSPRD